MKIEVFGNYTNVWRWCGDCRYNATSSQNSCRCYFLCADLRRFGRRIWSFFRFVFFLSSYGSQRDTCGFGLDSSMLRLHLHLFQETSRSGVQLSVLLLSMHARDHLRKSGQPRGNNLGVRYTSPATTGPSLVHTHRRSIPATRSHSHRK